jgi:PEP-CTERM motif
MHSEPQFFRTLWSALALAAVVALVVGMFVTPAFGQNPVPPTARQAAAMPQYASRLAHPASPAAAKSRASAPTRNHAASPQDQVIYENGPVNGTTDAWTINFGYVVSDSFVLNGGGTVTGFDIWVWEFPGDVMQSVDWSITSGPNSGTVYGSGTVGVTDTFISTNQFGYNIDEISASGLNVSASGSAWLNLYNAVVPSGDPVYWDENSGAGCKSYGCPSSASESALGTIASEAFTIGNGSVPEPGSIVLLGSGVLGLAGLLRRRLNL